MTGKIIKGIAGFYYVDTAESGIYECKAKGIFRKDQQKPLVGDLAEITVLDEKEKEGNIVRILPRENELIRPAVANVDQALVIFALNNPEPNRVLLDRFLIMMEQNRIPCGICLNKKDLVSEAQAEGLADVYRKIGYQVFVTSFEQEDGTEAVKSFLQGKTTVMAGPSGVGKSSLTNLFSDEIRMETGDISRKLKRGKHTTRHSQLVRLAKDTYLCDTPGFTSLYLIGIEKEELRMHFPELAEREGRCRFLGCVHDHEPECSVKEALSQGLIDQERYDNYIMFLHELQEQERRKY